MNNDITNTMFVVSEKETVEFSTHFQCYEVSVHLPCNKKIVYSNNFTCYLPLNVIAPFGQMRKKYVCLRHEIDMS